MSRQLRVDRVSVTYDGFTAVREASLDLEAGDIACLLGPSGCGKTSLLRAIAGFEPITTGCISLNDSELSTPKHTLPTEQRRVGMVFQDFALFPHLSVADNVGFGLSRLGKQERNQKIEEMLKLVGLGEYAASFPHQLSGGQQQRVALARALAPNPDLLLLDEPFSSLDSELRESLAAEVRALLKASGVTAVLVTHDQHEAFAVADHITLMKDGTVVQAGTPQSLYQTPDAIFVADFIGQGSVIDVTVSANGALSHQLGHLDPAVITGSHSGAVSVLLRPHEVVISSDSPVRLPVTSRAFRGTHFLYSLALPDGQKLECLADIETEVEIGETLPIRLDLSNPTIFFSN
jgi:iron(III) transport system ATP-binding protein